MTEQKHAVIAVGKAPLRANNNDRSEMVSQLLLGETVDVLREHPHKEWLYIRSRTDQYEGWVNKNETLSVESKTLQQWEEQSAERWPFASIRVLNKQGQGQWIPFGAQIQWNIESRECSLLDETFSWDSSIQLQAIKKEIPLLTALALRGTPYLWGGRSEDGLDCSGFMQLTLQVHGKQCQRDASEQVTMGTHVKGIEQAQRGDWVFFDVHGTGISHVGWYLGEQLLLHASGKVRVQRIARSEKKRFNDLFDLNKKLANSIADIRRIELSDIAKNSKLNKIGLTELLFETH